MKLRNRWKALFAAAALAIACGACVTRRIAIRSTPPGAPVWLDEKYVGKTPVDVPFVHYGKRKLQVGPIHAAGAGSMSAEGAVDEKEAAEGRAAPAAGYAAHRRMIDLRAPWYDWFPIDLVTNILVPWTIINEVPVQVTLAPSGEKAGEAQAVVERARAVRARAEAFRKRALHPAPEELPPAGE
jgi:hypothetical protein